MPTYDYICEACGAALEIFQSMKESAKKKCPECGKLKLKRQIGTGAGIIFKGSGFYETDYRSESYKKGAEADRKSAKESNKSETSDKGKKPASEKKSSKKKD